LEYAAFFIAYRYYLYLRKNAVDPIPTSHRLSIILGGAIGALIGSRLMGFLENPLIELSLGKLWQLLDTKTIMGGLAGGLLGVEITKGIIHEKHSSGDLFTLPVIVGIFIGRIGCFLAGTNEFTYGDTTTFFAGMNLGDGRLRHPLALYELLYLVLLFILLKRLYNQHGLQDGQLFQLFMVCYFSFRFFLEFLKPNVFFLLGLSSIQWLCMACLIYYRNFLIRIFRNAN
jgi:phosphatidylglycerol:prolipoprotein diacylglycerol transferase